MTAERGGNRQPLVSGLPRLASRVSRASAEDIAAVWVSSRWDSTSGMSTWTSTRVRSPSAVSCQRYSRSETRQEMVTRPSADEVLQPLRHRVVGPALGVHRVAVRGGLDRPRSRSTTRGTGSGRGRASRPPPAAPGRGPRRRYCGITPPPRGCRAGSPRPSRSAWIRSSSRCGSTSPEDRGRPRSSRLARYPSLVSAPDLRQQPVPRGPGLVEPANRLRGCRPAPRR